MREYQLSEVRT
jgi:hypothetical protein